MNTSTSKIISDLRNLIDKLESSYQDNENWQGLWGIMCQNNILYHTNNSFAHNIGRCTDDIYVYKGSLSQLKDPNFMSQNCVMPQGDRLVQYKRRPKNQFDIDAVDMVTLRRFDKYDQAY